MNTRRAFMARISARDGSALTPALSPGRGGAGYVSEPIKTSAALVALPNAARDAATTAAAIALPLLGERAGLRAGQSAFSVKWERHGHRSTCAFTLVEIAIALGVIGFALVAIIGILPTGLQIQRDNRAETIINQDGTFWIEAIRNGARGLDELVNHVESISLITSNYSVNPPTVSSSNYFKLNAGYTTGSNIIGLLTAPAYFRDTVALAVVTAISGGAAEKSSSAADRELAFRYQMTVQVERSTNNTQSFAALSAIADPSYPLDALNSLFELRLHMAYAWVRDEQPGTRRQTYRSTISRGLLALTNQSPELFFFVP